MEKKHDIAANEDCTAAVLKAAAECGFDMAGVSGLDLPEDEIEKYIEWLNQKKYGTMQYLPDGLEIKRNPEILLPGAMSVISVGLIYKSGITEAADSSHGMISEYARGRDYHKVLKKKLKNLSEKIRKLHPELEDRFFVDSAPVFEKLYGQNAGLGTKGKNSLLINPLAGSKFFIGELITNLPLKPTGRLEFNPCKNCRRCIETCPAHAIGESGELDASRCIAYLTIEYKGIIPDEFCQNIGNRIFGCDECQNCCPWNRRKVMHHEKDFSCRYQTSDLALEKLLSMTEDEYLKFFEGSVIRRTGWICFLRNVIIAAGNSENQALKKDLEKYASHENEILKNHAQRALKKLQESWFLRIAEHPDANDPQPE